MLKNIASSLWLSFCVLAFFLALTFATATTTTTLPSTIRTTELYKSTDDICNRADFDYDIELTDTGYTVKFIDTTNDGFIAYSDIIWSTVIPHPTDPLGSIVPSPYQTIRLKKINTGKWENHVELDSIFESVESIKPENAPTTWTVHNDNVLSQVKLRFYFKFWVVSPLGTHQICNSPFIIV